MVKILEDENNILDGVVPELDQDVAPLAPVEPAQDPAPEEPQNQGEPHGEFIDVMAIIQQLAQDCIVFQSILNDLEKEVNELFSNNGQEEENMDLEEENLDGDDPIYLLAILYNEVLEFYQAHPELPNPFLIDDDPSNNNQEFGYLGIENMGAENMEDNNSRDENEGGDIPMEECASNVGNENQVDLMDVKQGGEKLMDKKLFDEILEGKMENDIMAQNQAGNDYDDDTSSLSSNISVDGSLDDDVFLTTNEEVADDQIE